MFKIKKISIILLTILYIILTIIELAKYLCEDSNMFGLVYLFLSLIIIFLLVPVAYNYKRHYSKERISKLILVIVFGIFSSFILNAIVFKVMNYSDSSNEMIKSMFIIRNILKPVLYGFLLIFTIVESNIINKIRSKLK